MKLEITLFVCFLLSSTFAQDNVTESTDSAECSNRCSSNEAWTKSGRPCGDFCDQVDSECDATEGRSGCYCEAGYCRNRDSGDCVSVENGINGCGKHEKWYNGNETVERCQNSCGESCDRATMFCFAPCQSGCFCEAPYSRHPVTNQCVLDSCCPSSR